MVEFPITGPYRQPIMTLELIIIFIVFEISLYFFQKYINNRKNSYISFVEFDWGVIFLTYGLANTCYIFTAFFYVIRVNILIIAYLLTAIGGLIFSYHIESTKTINTKYFFTIFMSSLIITLLVTNFYSASIMRIFAWLSTIPAYILLFFYFFRVSKKLWSKYKRLSIGLFIGVFLWLFGFAATSDIVINLFNSFFIRLIGDIGIIIGITIIGIFLNFIPSLSEIGWQQKIKYLTLFSKAGICYYDEIFQKKIGSEDLILSGALSGVKIFIENLLKNDHELKVLSRENDVYLFEEGKYAIGVLVVQEELEILKYKLKQIIAKFEEFFGEILPNWNGFRGVFQPTNNIINDVLEI